MMIEEDMSYLSEIDKLAIKKEFARLDIFHLRIDREKLTKEEKEQGMRLYDTDREKWEKMCLDNKNNTASKVERLMELLSSKFDIYQYKDKGKNYQRNWDLFFWCNCNQDGTCDYSYVTLGFNHERTIEERLNDMNRAIMSIKEIGYDGLDINIQYTAKYDFKKVGEAIHNYHEGIKDTWIDLYNMKGKIKEVGIWDDGYMHYGFFKKGARTHYTKVPRKDLLMMAMAQDT